MSTEAVPPEVVRHLMPGETVLWWDRPRQGAVFTARDWLLIPFSLTWGGFAIVWESTVLVTKAPLLMRLWGIPFVLLGLFLIFGRFVVDAWIRRRMVYALTRTRVLIIRTGPRRSLTAVNLRGLPDLALDEGTGGRGTIRLGRTPAYGFGGRRANAGSLLPSLDPIPQLFAIPDARRVFERIQQLVGGTEAR